MAENSNISWTDHTHNEWIGCMKVSEGCRNCYAETMMDKRYHRVEWGQSRLLGDTASIGTRALTSEANRRKPFRWQRRAVDFMAEHGRRQRVFCSSLSDVFDNQVPRGWREDLFETIRNTSELDWLLLTKRPENIEAMLPQDWQDKDVNGYPHVWLGTTCEDQGAYDKRWPILRQIPASVRFVSYEPAIGPLDIRASDWALPDWVICGGESGPGHRDMLVEWAFNIKLACKVLKVPFFMKQIAARSPRDADIPADLMLREFPVAA